MACVPASRTPEGVPGNCPICNGRLDVEPSYPTGDATCPRCGSLVWVDDRPERPRPLLGLKTAPAVPVPATPDVPPPAVDRDPVPVGVTLAEIMGELEALRGRIEAACEVRQPRGFRRILDGLRSIFDASTGRRKAHSGVIETSGVSDPWIDGP